MLACWLLTADSHSLVLGLNLVWHCIHVVCIRASWNSDVANANMDCHSICLLGPPPLCARCSCRRENHGSDPSGQLPVGTYSSRGCRAIRKLLNCTEHQTLYWFSSDDLACSCMS